ncbi:aminoglycoside phosphotransferase family protein [Nocardioides korecus]
MGEQRQVGVRLQPLARAKAASLGEVGAAWVDGLPAVMDELAERWSLTWGSALPGGSASYVVAATTAEGEQRVVKLVMPGPERADEARVLRAAGGRGYVLVHDDAPEHAALLLERLGPSLDRHPPTPERTLDLLVDTLAEAWTLPLATLGPDAPPDKATSLHAMVRELDDRLGACDPRVRRQALAYAERRAAAGDPDAVVVHGDAHASNGLRVLAPRPGAASGLVLVDPDGFRCDPAYDLGVVLRDWTGRLADGGRRVLEEYADRVAERSGVDRQRIWEWAFLERVSTGLYVSGFGGHAIGARFLASAELLLD